MANPSVWVACTEFKLTPKRAVTGETGEGVGRVDRCEGKDHEQEREKARDVDGKATVIYPSRCTPAWSYTTRAAQ